MDIADSTRQNGVALLMSWLRLPPGEILRPLFCHLAYKPPCFPPSLSLCLSDPLLPCVPANPSTRLSPCLSLSLIAHPRSCARLPSYPAHTPTCVCKHTLPHRAIKGPNILKVLHTRVPAHLNACTPACQLTYMPAHTHMRAHIALQGHQGRQHPQGPAGHCEAR